MLLKCLLCRNWRFSFRLLIKYLSLWNFCLQRFNWLNWNWKLHRNISWIIINIIPKDWFWQLNIFFFITFIFQIFRKNVISKFLLYFTFPLRIKSIIKLLFCFFILTQILVLFFYCLLPCLFLEIVRNLPFSNILFSIFQSWFYWRRSKLHLRNAFGIWIFYLI